MQAIRFLTSISTSLPFLCYQIFYEFIAIAVELLTGDMMTLLLPYYAPYYSTPFPGTYVLPSYGTTDENGYLQYGANGNPNFGVFQGFFFFFFFGNKKSH
jgi:hypothetical protein